MVIDIPEHILRKHKRFCIDNRREQFSIFENRYFLDGGVSVTLCTPRGTVVEDTPLKDVYNAMITHDSTVGATAKILKEQC